MRFKYNVVVLGNSNNNTKLRYYLMARMYCSGAWFSLCTLNRLFLIGLKKFGKGDWRSISRNVVVTRTPTQVASHAQKYFLRQTSMKKERKRSSIHDITTVESNSVSVPADRNWIPPPAVPAHQSPLQHLTQQSHLPDQGDLSGYQDFGFPM